MVKSYYKWEDGIFLPGQSFDSSSSAFFLGSATAGGLEPLRLNPPGASGLAVEPPPPVLNPNPPAVALVSVGVALKLNPEPLDSGFSAFVSALGVSGALSLAGGVDCGSVKATGFDSGLSAAGGARENPCGLAGEADLVAESAEGVNENAGLDPASGALVSPPPPPPGVNEKEVDADDGFDSAGVVVEGVPKEKVEVDGFDSAGAGVVEAGFAKEKPPVGCAG